jgi:ABC-2 type transport system permease protein
VSGARALGVRALGVRALRAEWTKTRTAPGSFWLLLGAVAVTVAVSGLAVAAASCRSLTAACQADPARLSLTGADVGQAVVAVLAVLAISTEYSTGMIRVTFTALPGRLGVLAAKAIVLTGLVLPTAVIAMVVSQLTGRLVLPGHGFTAAHGYAALSLGDPAVLRATLGSALYLALVALLSLGVATIVRDPAVAVGTVLALLYLFPIVTSVVGDPRWQRHLEQIGPMSAGLAIQATVNLASLPLSPWAGLGVLAAWAAGALLLGGALLALRDT